MIHLAKLSEELAIVISGLGDSHLIWREAYINMAAVALNTSKVKNRHRRHESANAPSVGCRQRLCNVEEYSPGRMIVGIGLGDSSVETMGMKPAKTFLLRKDHAGDARLARRLKKSS